MNEAQFKTRKDAERHKYGAWAGRPNGSPYDPTRCAEEVQETGRGGMFYQCQRPPGYGPSKLYCKQHDPAAKEERRKASEQRWNTKQRGERPRWYAFVMLDLLRTPKEQRNEKWEKKRQNLLKTIDE